MGSSQIWLLMHVARDLFTIVDIYFKKKEKKKKKNPSLGLHISINT